MKKPFIPLCLSVAFVTVATVQAVEQRRPNRLEPSDIFNLHFAADPQISPDGKQIVYVRKFREIMTDQQLSNLWVLNFDGTGHQALTTGAFNDSSPRWSSDGTRLLFISNRSGAPQLYVYWMDTARVAQITSLQSAPQGPIWSPDGKQIAFASFVSESPKSYAPLAVPPPAATWQPRARVIDKAVYRNGLGYLRTGYTQLFVIPAEGGVPRKITSDPYNHGDGQIVWTPDGRHLLLAAETGGDADLTLRGREIFEVSVADGSARALTSRKGPDESPTVSPDGKLIAYVGFDDEGYDYQLSQLYVMNRDGSGVRVISTGLDRDAEHPHWAPDGSGIYFVYDDQGSTRLAFATLDGRVKEIARDLGGSDRAVTSRGFYSVASNGRFTFLITQPHVPGDIAVATMGSSSAHVITHVNEGLLANKTLGQVEEIWYPSSLDGLKLQGWIIKPPDFDPSRKYPLILEPHGGPLQNVGPRFDVEKQLMAARGYVVFYPNYRGSTSYGFKFGHLIEKVHPGIVGDDRNPGDVTHDLNSGVDAVIAKGYVDPDNLFVTGLSAGGTLTMWMIEHTNRFRAAVPQCPSGANWASFVLYSDRPDLVYYRFPGPPWEHAEHYMKRSPLMLIKNVKTPTMILAGDEDYLTPIANMEEYYFALKLLKVETVLIRFPGEPHGIFRYPSHQVAKVQYMLSWFDEHRTKAAPSAGAAAGR